MFARVGDVVTFRYKSDEAPRFLKVTTVRDTDNDRVINKSWPTERNRYLVTGRQAPHVFRSFYTDNVQPGARCLSRWERVKLWFSGVRF